MNGWAKTGGNALIAFSRLKKTFILSIAKASNFSDTSLIHTRKPYTDRYSVGSITAIVYVIDHGL